MNRLKKKDIRTVLSLTNIPISDISTIYPSSKETRLELFVNMILPPGLEDYVPSSFKTEYIDMRKHFIKDLEERILPDTQDKLEVCYEVGVPYLLRLQRMFPNEGDLKSAFDKLPYIQTLRSNLHHNVKINRKLKEYGTRGCASCLKNGPWKHCARCKSAYYCSLTCQKKDWEKHKLICKGSTK